MQEFLVFVDLLDHKELKVQLDFQDQLAWLVHQEHKAHPVLKEILVQLVHLVLKELMVTKE